MYIYIARCTSLGFFWVPLPRFFFFLGNKIILVFLYLFILGYVRETKEGEKKQGKKTWTLDSPKKSCELHQHAKGQSSHLEEHATLDPENLKALLP